MIHAGHRPTVTHYAANYGIMCDVCPALVKEITPPHIHIKVDVLFRAGALQSNTVGAPTIHGAAAVAGMQGMGVKTPEAANVAAATTGLDGDWHMPNGRMFIIGALSNMFAATKLLVITVLGVGMSVLGAIPKLHFIIPPIQV